MTFVVCFSDKGTDFHDYFWKNYNTGESENDTSLYQFKWLWLGILAFHTNMNRFNPHSDEYVSFNPKVNFFKYERSATAIIWN